MTGKKIITTTDLKKFRVHSTNLYVFTLEQINEFFAMNQISRESEAKKYGENCCRFGYDYHVSMNHFKESAKHINKVIKRRLKK
jgi:hypothetical protein